ncbi:restriction endonuclease subunit S, partial [Escherichia coli]|uniref:restriction endonuclease subunit S n=1 Tax=Escherichia coli TaxID=562 RepID=UPI003563BFB9
IGPDPRNFNQRVSLGRNDLLIRTFPSGGTMLHVTKEKMESTKAAFPSYEEQTAIATILSDMDAEIQALEQRLGKTRQIKQGMMQELLTGKTRLPYDKE